MKNANPYLNFPGNTEEAFEFYRTVFGGEFASLVRFRDFGESMGELPEPLLDKVAHVSLPIGETLLMGTDSLEGMGPALEPGNNVSIALAPESKDEAERVFAALSDGGTVQMELQATDWAEAYGSLADRFGVQWQVNYEGDVRFGSPA
jgi:PhnB protein